MLVALLVLRQQHDGRGRRRTLAGGDVDIGQIDLTAHDRLDARACRRDGEFQRGEHVVRVGHGDGGHTCVDAQARQLFQADRAFEQGVFAVNAQMDESGGI